MRPITAFDLGYRSARSGFFFDAMELAAFVAPDVGGVDALRHAVALIFDVRDDVRDDMAWVCQTVSDAYRRPTPNPDGVDAYRSLLTEQVFDIVNRWSFIGDIQTVNRLQAWFYAGFGLGRTETVCRGLGLVGRLAETASATHPALVAALPRMQRLAAEAARQLEVPAQEDDLQGVRPLLEQAAAHARALALRAQRTVADTGAIASDADLLEACAQTARKVRMDLAHVGAHLA